MHLHWILESQHLAGNHLSNSITLQGTKPVDETADEEQKDSVFLWRRTQIFKLVFLLLKTNCSPSKLSVSRLWCLVVMCGHEAEKQFAAMPEEAPDEAPDDDDKDKSEGSGDSECEKEEETSADGKQEEDHSHFTEVINENKRKNRNAKAQEVVKAGSMDQCLNKKTKATKTLEKPNETNLSTPHKVVLTTIGQLTPLHLPIQMK